MSETSSFDISPEQQAAIEDLADKRGISMEMAQRAFFGAKIQPKGPIAAPKEPVKHRGSYVRGFYDGEPRDSELYKSDEPLSDEQHAINAEGLAGLQSFRDKLEIENAIRRTEEEFSDPDPYDPKKYQEEKERVLNARLRKIYDQRHPHAS